MQKIFIFVSVLISALLLSCSKTDNPVAVTTGEVNGVVTHAFTGNSISQVRVYTKDSSYSVTTDVTGAYKLLKVAPGNYTLYAEKAGFNIDTIFVSVDAGRVTIGDFTISPIGSISGVITDAATNAPIPGITITTNPVTATVTTDATGSYTLSNVREGMYTILIEGLVAYRETTVSGVKVGVSEDVTKNVEVSQLRWSASSTDNYSNTAIPLSINPLVAGSPIAIGDKIGVFYDSSGVTVCAGLTVWNGESTQISAWGDETLSPTTTKEGFAINEEMQWRIKRASDGRIFAAAVTYSQGNNKYRINQINILQMLVAN